jgi:hypothetical protein
MTILTPITGKWLRISQSTTLGGTYVLVKGMNSLDKNSNRTTTTEDTFDTTNAYSEAGPREKSYTINGLMVPDDPGRIAVWSQEAADASYFFKFLPAGGSTDGVENVKGWTHQCKVGSTRYGAQSGGGAQTCGFDLISQGDEATSGTGGYIL